MVTPTVQLTGPRVADYFSEGEKAASDLRTAELNRQIAAEELRIRQADLAMRQAAAQRTAAAAQRAEQQRQRQAQLGVQYGRDVNRIMADLAREQQAAALPPTVTRAQPTTQPQPSTYSPLGMYYGGAPMPQAGGRPAPLPGRMNLGMGLPQAETPPVTGPSGARPPLGSTPYTAVSEETATPPSMGLSIPSAGVEPSVTGTSPTRPPLGTSPYTVPTASQVGSFAAPGLNLANTAPSPGVSAFAAPGLEETRTPLQLKLARNKQDRELAAKIEKLRRGIATGKYGAAGDWLRQIGAWAYDQVYTGESQGKRNQKARQLASDMLDWYQKPSTRKLFEKEPQLVDEALADPQAFYEEYKDLKAKDIRPVRPITAATAPSDPRLRFESAAPFEVAAVDKRDTKAIQRLIGEPGVTTADIITQTMKPANPANIGPPNLRAYAVDPPKASRDVRIAGKLLQLESLAIRYYSGLMRDNPNMLPKLMDHVSRFQKIAAHRQALRGIQAVSLFASGDPRLAEQLLSNRLGVTVELRPSATTPNAYDRFENGQLVRANIAARTVLDSIRREVEVGYKAREAEIAAERRKAEQAVLLELIKERRAITAAQLKAAGITKISDDPGRSAVFAVTGLDGSIEYRRINLAPPTGSPTSAKEQLRPQVEIIGSSRGVIVDPRISE